MASKGHHDEKPYYMSITRARGLTTDTLDGFFKILDELLTKLGIKDDPERIFNSDEIGLGSESRNKKMFFRRGVKNSLMITPTEGRSMFTVMFCGNTNGRFLPLYVTYKRRSEADQERTLPVSWMLGGPKDTHCNVTRSGWMEDYVFEQWLKNVFVDQVKELTKDKTVVLLYDGHGSHMTFETCRVAVENNISIICLPPHTSHALQSSDVGVYPAKAEFLSNCKKVLCRKSPAKPTKNSNPLPFTKRAL